MSALDRLLARLRDGLEKYLLVWFLLLAGAAWFWARWWPSGPNPFAAIAPYLKYLFTVTMLAIGSLLPRDEIRQVFRRWPSVLAGTAVQYTSMPLLGYWGGRLMGLEGEWLIGVVIVGAVPGAMASNVLTLVARGNVSYSVSLTTSATMLSPLVVPLVLWLALRRWVSLDFAQIVGELCWMVVVPVIVGHMLARLSAFWRAGAERLGAIVANLAILLIIAVVVANNSDKLHLLTTQLLAALAILNFGGYLAGYFGGWGLGFPEPTRRALTLEVGMQNAGLGSVLAVELFGKSSSACIAPALFTFGCMFTGVILARVWSAFPPREETVG
jgi:BASS family bile acid:Na+ symporter